MPELTTLIKDKIAKIYKTPENFSKIAGIPYEKALSAANGNIGDLNYCDVADICNELGITLDFFPDSSQATANTHMLSALDTKGIQKVYSTAISVHNKFSGKKRS